MTIVPLAPGHADALLDAIRDSAADLLPWLGPRYAALQTRAEVDAFIAAWKLPVECGEVAPDGSYSVGHPASAWVLDPQGRQRLHIPFSATPQQVSAASPTRNIGPAVSTSQPGGV